MASIMSYFARTLKGVVKAAAPKKHECHHIIRHATTPAERKQVMERLHYFRNIGDMEGVMLALAMLGRCECPGSKDRAGRRYQASPVVPPRGIAKKCIEQKMRMRGISEKAAAKECYREWREYMRPRTGLPKKLTIEALGMKEPKQKKKRRKAVSVLVPGQIPGWARGASGWTARSRVRRLKSKLWIKGAVKHKGKLRTLLGTPPGQVIPAWIKTEGCKDPRRTFARALKRIPSAKESREFQKMACLARTLMEIGAKRRVRVRRAA